MYCLEAQETSKNGIKRILLEQIDINIALLMTPGDDPDIAVHEARKNIKRLRAALRLVRGVLDPEVYHRENICFRDAGRQLAPLRDSAVLVETIDALREQFGLAPDAFAFIRDQLVAAQMQQRQTLLYKKKVPTAVAAILDAARTRIAAIELPGDDFTIFADGLERVYRSGRKRMQAAYAHPQDAHRFHDWRKRVKYLWHHSEILQLVWPVVMDRMAEELHKISSLLGDAHDLAVLQETIQAQPQKFGASEEIDQLFVLVEQRRVELETAAYPYGQRMYAESPKAFVKRIATYYAVWQQYGINGIPIEVLFEEDTESATITIL